MKRKLYAASAAVILVVAIKNGLIGAAWMFLLVGAIPGTHASIPSGVMLILYGMVIWLVFCHRTAWLLVRSLITRHTIKRRTTPQTRSSRRRYSGA